MKKSAPTNFAGMNQGAEIRGGAGGDVAGLPGVGWPVERHVNHDRSSDDMAARNAADVTAVQRIAAIVTHHEIAALGHGVRKLVWLAFKSREVLEWIGALGAAEGVVFLQAGTVDPDAAITNIHRFARQPDHTFNDIRTFAANHRTKNHDLQALRIAPQTDVHVGEWDAGVVAQATHDQVVADQQRIFHRFRRNHSRLADGSIDQQKHQGYPEPGDNFAADFLLHRKFFGR